MSAFLYQHSESVPSKPSLCPYLPQTKLTPLMLFLSSLSTSSLFRSLKNIYKTHENKIRRALLDPTLEAALMYI